MATSSERTSPPPFPDSEDQDLAECEEDEEEDDEEEEEERGGEVGEDEDSDLFLSAVRCVL